jgi:short-subunit dehydrogenase
MSNATQYIKKKLILLFSFVILCSITKGDALYTLITGASSGIGLELAKEFAKKKCNLIITARSKDKLNELSQTLSRDYNIKVQVLALDLSLPETPRKIFQECLNQGWEIENLVNNAGFGDHGRFANAAWLKQKEMLQVNITALTELTHLFLPSMLKNKNGKILNVASTAAFQPGPLMAVYYATKAYVLSFSEALNEELSGTGITVTTLCPGPTASGFQKTANLNNVMLLQAAPLPSSEEVAKYAIDALYKRKSIAVHGWLNWAMAESVRFTPRKWVLKLVKRLQEKRT